MRTFKLLSLLLAFAGLSLNTNAQTIIVQKADGTNARVFNNIDDAVAGADANDYVYLGGGQFVSAGVWRGYNGTGAIQQSQLIITKPLHFVGGGTNNGDATTRIKATRMALRKAASGSTFTGIVFETQLHLDSISNVVISRCLFQHSSYLYLRGNGSNVLIAENKFDGNAYIVGDARNLESAGNSVNAVYGVIVSKNIFADSHISSSVDNLSASNNIVLAPSGSYDACSGSSLSVENNIFIGAINTSGARNSSWKNNVTFNPITNTDVSNVYQGNMSEFDITPAVTHLKDIFVNYQEGDYRLKPAYQTTLLGTDGTQAGLYGTANPFKIERTTAYPQFLLRNVANETDGQGNLGVEIKVEAQTR